MRRASLLASTDRSGYSEAHVEIILWPGVERVALAKVVAFLYNALRRKYLSY
jgi:hypothetical protein